mmetsp:Transcript_58387/g.69697  ORF Transcript_58387/g.69697 Transcript_58387/m.69697 type:complete len:171 (-) Transcript_58387:177-689(-)
MLSSHPRRRQLYFFTLLLPLLDPFNQIDHASSCFLNAANHPHFERKSIVLQKIKLTSLEKPSLPEERATISSSSSSSPDSEDTSWRQCITSPSPKTGPINEAVSLLTSLPLSTCNDLIAIGAVWAKTTEADLYDDEYDAISSSSHGWNNNNNNGATVREGTKNIFTACTN